MNFRDLKAAINAATLHDLADTNALGVSVTSGLEIEFDDSHCTERIAELGEDVKRYEESEKELQQKLDDMTKERDDMEEIVRMVRVDGEKETLAHYEQLAKDNHARAETEAAYARDYRKAMDAAQAECRALRKRKGVTTGLLRHEREVMYLLGYISQQTPHGAMAHPVSEAANLLAKINASK